MNTLRSIAMAMLVLWTAPAFPAIPPVPEVDLERSSVVVTGKVEKLTWTQDVGHPSDPCHVVHTARIQLIATTGPVVATGWYVGTKAGCMRPLNQPGLVGPYGVNDLSSVKVGSHLKLYLSQGREPETYAIREPNGLRFLK